MGIPITGCNPIADHADRSREKEQLESAKQRDDAAEAITGEQHDRNR